MMHTVTQADLVPMLAEWLPRQRWFPARGRALGEVTLISDVPLSDRLRHLIVETQLADGLARFQVLAGLGSAPPTPDSVIGSVAGRVVFDALHDQELAALLLHAIARQRRAGPLRFVRAAAAALDGMPAGFRLLTAEQSNTSVVFGETAILKVLRRLFPGANPDLEVAAALARHGSPRVAAPFGWVEARLDGEAVLLAVLSEYLAGARDGWALAGQALDLLYADPAVARVPLSATQARVPLPFAAQARQLGEATALLHADLATAFGERAATTGEIAALGATLTAKLTDAAAHVPELAAHAPRIASAYAALTTRAIPVALQRIHGDYHLGQVVRSRRGWVALDFEGEPAVPLAERRSVAPVLRDVAGMLRSFDYAARHRLVRGPCGPDLAVIASTWVARCQQEFCAGYAAAGGADPRDQAVLLRALMLEKAVYEVVYEHRYRPSWLPIPLGYVAAA